MSKKKANPTAKLDEVIDRLHAEMSELEAHSEEFSKMADQLEKLYKIRNTQRPVIVDRNALIAVAGNLAGIVTILMFERDGIITSKALGFVTKTKF